MKNLLCSSFMDILMVVKIEHSEVLIIIKIRKKKLIAEKKMFLSEKKLRIWTFPFQRNAFPATKKIYFQHIENLYVNMVHLYICNAQKNESN